MLKFVGQPYEKLDAGGKALGCMAPVYLLYPEIPRYEWPEEGETFAESVLSLLKRHGQAVDVADIQPGDVVAFKMPLGFLHVGVYLGRDEIIHCMTGDSMERCRFGLICRRLEGVFRWPGR